MSVQDLIRGGEISIDQARAMRDEAEKQDCYGLVIELTRAIKEAEGR